MLHPWIAQRTTAFNSSGIRKIFDLASKLDNPVNLSIGQPDYDVPDPVKDAMVDAVKSGKNAYSQTQGIPQLRSELKSRVDAQLGHDDRDVFVCSGTSGGLVLAMLAMVNPGDEVIFLDPYFVMYPSLVSLAGGVPVPVDCAPGFRLDPERIEAAITPKTKMIIINSPGNPTGILANEAEIKAVAELAARHNVALLSDEIYRCFCYDEPFVSPAKFNPDTIVIDGFSKSHAMTGWRLGFVHGPQAVIEVMLKLQQYTFVCAPHPVQWAGLTALQTDMTQHVNDYRRKRDLIVDGLADLYEIARPGGAFYAFPKLPWGTGESFVTAAINQNLLVIPGSIFSRHDTHFRISYAATDEDLSRGIEILRNLAENRAD